jgi:MFS family permease
MQISKSAIFASGVFLAGVVGDLVGGLVSDWLLKRTGRLNVARRNLIVVAYLGALVAMIPVMFLRDPVFIAISLSAGLFFCEIIIGPIWSVPMDITPEYCSTATGIMSAGATIASIISPVAAGFMIDQTGNWNLPFATAIALLLVGAVLAFFIKPEEPFNPYDENLSLAASRPRA